LGVSPPYVPHFTYENVVVKRHNLSGQNSQETSAFYTR